MEIFHAFDGEIVWAILKRRLSFLQSSGKVATESGATPDRKRIWKLTTKGKEIMKETFPEDQPTETAEK